MTRRLGEVQGGLTQVTTGFLVTFGFSVTTLQHEVVWLNVRHVWQSFLFEVYRPTPGAVILDT